MREAEKKQKVGILGGTFDPVHKGHMAVARMVLERFQLAELFFVPAFSPPHKDRSLTAFPHRVAMLEAALAGDDRMSVSILEAERSAPSYTVETLREFHRRMGSSSFYLVMGADMFAEIELWYRFGELFELADIIVASRPGVSAGKIAKQVAMLPGMFRFDAEQQMWCRNDGARIFYCPDISETVSSSQIRARFCRGSSVVEYLPPSVWEYIQRHGLYSCCSGDVH